MKESKIKIADLKSSCECFDAIDSIKDDPINSLGGIKAWNSGERTYLTFASKNKIAAINRKLDKFLDEEDDV
jgi:hypothetical protein